MEHFCLVFTNQNSLSSLRMTSPRPCTQQTSMSSIISMAEYIVECFPFLLPNYKFDGEWPKLKITKEQPWEEGIYHPYLEIWNRLIMEVVLNRNALAHKNTLYAQICIAQPVEQLEKHPDFEMITLEKETNSSWNKLQTIFKLPVIEPSNKRIAILATHQYNRVGYPFSMRIFKDGILLGALFNNEQWSVLYFGRGEIPTAEELASYNVIILPGSNDSALNWTPELQTYMDNLDKALQLNPTLRILGICYGHQIISRFYGGKIEKKGRKGGIQKLQIDPALRQKYSFLRQLPAETLLISSHHEDDVVEMPEGFNLLFRSDRCQIEGLISHDGRILTTQFHSEYFPVYTKLYQDRTAYYFRGVEGAPILKDFYLPSDPETEKISMKHSLNFYNCFRAFIGGSAS